MHTGWASNSDGQPSGLALVLAGSGSKRSLLRDIANRPYGDVAGSTSGNSADARCFRTFDAPGRLLTFHSDIPTTAVSNVPCSGQRNAGGTNPEDEPAVLPPGVLCAGSCQTVERPARQFARLARQVGVWVAAHCPDGRSDSVDVDAFKAAFAEQSESELEEAIAELEIDGLVETSRALAAGIPNFRPNLDLYLTFDGPAFGRDSVADTVAVAELVLAGVFASSAALLLPQQCIVLQSPVESATQTSPSAFRKADVQRDLHSGAKTWCSASAEAEG